MASRTAPASTALGRASRALDHILARPGVAGAMLASRDGLPVLHVGASFGNLETFSAMQATALGAAEMALAGMSGQRALGLVIDMGDRRVLTRGVTEALVLVLMVDRTVPWEKAFEWMHDAGAALDG